VEIGVPAVPALRGAASGRDLEVVQRARAALESIEQRLEALRAEHRQAAEAASGKGDHVAAGRHYRALLALHEPPPCDCRSATRFFQAVEDWGSLAEAMEVTGATMKRIIRTPAAEFVRPASEGPPEADFLVPGPVWDARCWVYVQSDLDGLWRHGGGTPAQWLPVIRARQEAMKRERAAILWELARVYRDRLQRLELAARACSQALDELPFYTEPIDKLVAKVWPTPSIDGSALWPATPQWNGRDALNDLSELQEQTGHLRAAVETRMRVALAVRLLAGTYDNDRLETDKLWSVVRRLPAGAPLPKVPWVTVLGRDRPTAVFAPSTAESIPTWSSPYLLVTRPGDEVDTIEVTADVEGQGGYVQVGCRTIVAGRSNTFGLMSWYPDKERKKRQRLAKTFPVPREAAVIRLYSLCRDIKDFRIHKIEVKATFQPSPVAGSR